VCNRKCVKTCGVDAHTYTGKVTCTRSKDLKPKAPLVPNEECEKVGLSFPKVPTHDCDSTPLCARYLTSPTDNGETLDYSGKHVAYEPQIGPPEGAHNGMVSGPKKSCTTTCGFPGAVKYGKVWCALRTRVKSDGVLPVEAMPSAVRKGKHVSDKACDQWDINKPDQPQKNCPGTPACVQWGTQSASGMGKSCPSSCGLSASTIYGRVFCREINSGQEVADSKCHYWRQSKPSQPNTHCAGTPACTQWVTSQPGGCPGGCGQGASTQYGGVHCQTTAGTPVGDNKCHYWNQAKPAAPTRYCGGTGPCGPPRLGSGQCCLWLGGRHSGYCTMCPGGNHHVWPWTCGSSRKCN
jgi:hypothetical protein